MSGGHLARRELRRRAVAALESSRELARARGSAAAELRNYFSTAPEEEGARIFKNLYGREKKKW